MPNTQSEQELREEFFDGPASDSMSFEQFLIRKGRGDLIRPDVGGPKSGGVLSSRLLTRGYKKGGEVTKRKTKKKKARGCGIAKKGTRKAKMY